MSKHFAAVAAPIKLISYRRVSTEEQGASGLGLEAQQTAITRHAAAAGCTIVRDYVEIASGGDDERPQLAAAILHAKRIGATLAVAAIDRISRDAAKCLAVVKDLDKRVIDVSDPSGSMLMLQIKAVLAEDERRRIIERTERALAELIAKGALLGSRRPGHWHGREDRRLHGARVGNARSAIVRKLQAREAYGPAMDVVSELKGSSLRTIAAELDRRGISTATGRGSWTASGVRRMIAMMSE